MKVYTIWRESSGGFVLKQGDDPIHQGDTCHKRFEAESWDVAMSELYKFMDQRTRDGAVG